MRAATAIVLPGGRRKSGGGSRCVEADHRGVDVALTDVVDDDSLHGVRLLGAVPLLQQANVPDLEELLSVSDVRTIDSDRFTGSSRREVTPFKLLFNVDQPIIIIL